MPEFVDSIEEATQAIVDFREKREWAQYHTPGHLANALSIEASELQEEFLWKTPEEIEEHIRTGEGREQVEAEVADVLIYALLFCEATGIDPLEAIARKLEKNEEKYPSEEVKGDATL